MNGDGKLDIVFGKRSLMQQLPNYLMWLDNNWPAPPPALNIWHQKVACHDNNTPADPADDVRELKITLNNPANQTGLFVLSDQATMAPLDTFAYQTMAVYRWPAGSADDGLTYALTMSDLTNPTLSQLLSAPPSGTCSFEAPATIGIFDAVFSCDDNGTPHFAADDYVQFALKAVLQNSPQASPGYTISSDAGAVQCASISNLQYGTPYYFTLPPGSATGMPQITLSFQDKQDSDVLQALTFDNPGVCSTSNAWEASGEDSDIRLFPNPASGEEDLHIRLGSTFYGTVKLEILSLDGRIVHTQYLNKTNTEQDFMLSLSSMKGIGSSFWIRVSDDAGTSVKKIIHL